MLRKVVFPDPLAPTIPTSSPGRISTEMESAAVTIPKDLVRSMVCRMDVASGTLGLPIRAAEPTRQALVDRPESLGTEEDDGQHDDPQDHLPLVGEILGGVRADELEGDGPHQRPGHAGEPPQERH